MKSVLLLSREKVWGGKGGLQEFDQGVSPKAQRRTQWKREGERVYTQRNHRRRREKAYIRSNYTGRMRKKEDTMSL